MNKKALSRLAKKAANIKWKEFHEKQVQKLLKEIGLKTGYFSDSSDEYNPIFNTVTYLVSKYRITKR